MEPIAEWHLHASKQGSARIPVCLTVYRPQAQPESTCSLYQTFVEIKGISAKPRHVSGVSSLQSMVLALRILQVYVESALNHGWLFYIDDTDSPVDAASLIFENRADDAGLDRD